MECARRWLVETLRLYLAALKAAAEGHPLPEDPDAESEELHEPDEEDDDEGEGEGDEVVEGEEGG